ncbi:unnamed protein product [Cuscuta campestris]|uniref:C2H2-type domain-containing protein n=1 Tax=Cuscuta campestris TaxID=132261 RepID=A0A484N2Y2_9ASTE|nr:unnamed protein product [Cuscuta campestris]
MGEVMEAPVEGLDRRRERSPAKSADEDEPSPPPPPPPPHPRRGRDRDSRERRDERDLDRRGGRGSKDFDRNQSPSPPPLRERDHKRSRPSSSPPPPPYRNRRGGHSPPSRRSSPHYSHKRSRRDEYDGRRGSPRGGYGPGERRFSGGLDNPSGHEREKGGRHRYPDERPHARYGGRSSDWDSSRSGYGDAVVSRGSQREGLKSYKQFIQELEDDILPAEAERRYREYKSGYIEAQKRAYFDEHKDEEWLKDKYHPTNLVTAIERRNEHAQKLAKEFLLDLRSGTLDLGPGVTSTRSNKTEQSSNPNSDDEADTDDKRRRHGRELSKDVMLLSQAPKAHPVSSEPRRILIDIEQAQTLVGKLDSEKAIEENILSRSDNDRGNRDKSNVSSGPVVVVRGLTSVKGLEGAELLETLLTYLWRIHGVDYYGMSETNEGKGLRHVIFDGTTSEMSSNGADWEAKLDSYWQERLKGQDPLEVRTAKDKIDTAAVEALDPYVRKIRDEKYGWKYGCGAKGCTKLFHAAEFVHKHLKLKHTELVLELTSTVRKDLYFKNYMNDENAPGGTPVMLPSQPKEKLQKQRPSLESRLKDNRGDRRERNGVLNGSETLDRSENPLSDKFSKDNDGGNPDEQMFDSFGGHGIPVAAFHSDITPPPVLMPVPGAGPLGPFVPAPPEIAMQMFREQGGGPAPFEGGRNGRQGLHMGGSAPIIALPHRLRQDPRRLRSYQDLDAPEDEVTVIDYRSL